MVRLSFLQLDWLNLVKLDMSNLEQENQKLKAQLITAKRELGQRNEQLVEKVKDHEDSVNYAKRIQVAMMQPEYVVKERLPDSFIIFQPKDVVSGDFYFIGRNRENNDIVVFSAIDCTGHGVPGALLSIIGFNFIQQAVREKGLTKPSDILTFLDDSVNRMLRQTGRESGVQDGMDLALCTLNKKTLEVQYAGAYNSMYYVTNNELHEIKADRSPIGVNESGIPDVYTNHVVQLKKGDTMYLLSDGFVDQFGGKKGAKFKYKPLRELLLTMQGDSMEQQKRKLERAFEDWKGTYDQVDDVLIIGVKV